MLLVAGFIISLASLVNQFHPFISSSSTLSTIASLWAWLCSSSARGLLFYFIFWCWWLIPDLKRESSAIKICHICAFCVPENLQAWKTSTAQYCTMQICWYYSKCYWLVYCFIRLDNKERIQVELGSLSETIYMTKLTFCDWIIGCEALPPLPIFFDR